MFLFDENYHKYNEYSKNLHLKPSEYFPHRINAITKVNETVNRTNYLKKCLDNAEYVLSVSDKFAQIYKKCNVKNIITIENGISNILKYKKKNMNKKLVFGFFGGMSIKKGYKIIIDCLKTTYFKNSLFIIVDTSKPYNYHRNTYINGNKISFFGHQSNMQELYDIVNVCICLSLWEESYCLISREAQKVGCYVIGSSYGSTSSDIINNVDGFVINPNINSLKNIIRMMDRNYKSYLDPIKKKIY